MIAYIYISNRSTFTAAVAALYYIHHVLYIIFNREKRLDSSHYKLDNHY